MSKTIDERVVSMQFDNKHFERNVQTTMSTLDKLKQKLNLSGAAKGLEDVNKSARNVNLNPLTKGVETVTAKFSALQVMGTTALVNLTNQAVNAGKRFVSALTVAPVGDGFKEYEMTLNAVQTTMAGTGKTAKEVEEQLKKLDEYADKTVYSTADMLNNLPKFTNAGVELETATKAMIGIANATALAGGDAGKASIAFYNLGQAIGTGYLTRMDYNSINNAGIATMEWKEQMIEAAIAQGTLTKVGEDAYKAGNKTLTLQQLFIDGLQEQWATTEVMIKVFGDYGDETKDIGKKAYSAAQDIKTFSMMMESLKATAGTGWKDTWQIIFGGLDEAKQFWTGLSNFISGILTKISDVRNSILESALSKSLVKFTDNVNGLIKPGKKVASVVKKASVSMEKLDEMARKVWRGDFGVGKERYDKLTAAGENYYRIQNRVNELLGENFRHTEEQIEAQDKLLGIQGETNEVTGDTVKTLGELTDEEVKQLAKLTELSDEQLRSKGYTEDQIEAFRELRKASEELGIPMEKLIKNLDEIDGRWMIIESFKNIGEYLGKVFDSFKKAWSDIFGEGIKGEDLSDLITEFYKLTESMEFTEDQASRLTNILKGIFSAIDLSWSLASVSFMGGLKILNEILKLFGTDLGAVLEMIANKITWFNQWVENKTIFGSTTKYSDLAQILVTIYNGIKKCIEAFIGLERVRKVVDRIKKLFEDLFGSFDGAVDRFSLDGVIETITKFFDNIAKWIEGIDTAKNIGLYIIQGIGKGLWEGIKKATSTVVKVATAIFDAFCEFFGIHSPSKLMMTVGMFLIDGLILGILAKNTDLGSTIKDLGSKLLGWFKTVFGNVSGSFSDFGSKIGSMFKNIDFGKVFSGIISIAMLALIKKITDGLVVLTKPLTTLSDVLASAKGFIGGLKDSLERLSKAMAFETRTEGIKNLALSIGIVLGAITTMVLIIKKFGITAGEVWHAFGIMVAVSAVLVGLTWVMSKISESTVDIGKSGMSIKSAMPKLISLAASLLLVVWAIKLIAAMKPEDYSNGFEGLLKTIAALVGVVGAISLFSRGSTFDAKGTGKMLRNLAITLLIMVGVVKLVGMLNEEELTKGALFMAGFAIFLTAMGIAARIGGENIKEIGSVAFKLAIALALLALTVKLIDTLNLSAMLKGAAFAAGFALFIKALVWAGKVGKDYYSANVGGLILSVSVAMLLMVGVCKLIGMLSVSDIAKGVVFAAAMTILIRSLIGITKLDKGQKLGQVAGTITALAVALGIMAAITITLGLINLEYLAKGIIAVGLLSTMMSVMVHQLKDAKNATGSIIAMTVALGIMVAAIVALSFIDPVSLAGSTGAIVAVMGMFALLMRSTSKTRNTKNLLKTLILMTVVIATLAIIIFEMSNGIRDPESAISAAGSISAVLLALMGTLKILSTIDKRKLKVGKNLITSLGLMVAVIGVLGLIMAGLSHITNPESVIPTAIGLSAMLLAMTGVLVVLSKIKVGSKDVAKNIGLLTALVIPLAAFALAINYIPMGNISGKKEALIVLAGVMLAMSAVLLAVSAIGGLSKLMGGGMMTAMIGLVALCGVLALFAHALNEIPMDQIAGKKDGILVTAATMAAMTVLLLAVTAVGALMMATGGMSAIAGIAGLAVMCGLLALFGWALNAIPMDQIAGKKEAIIIVAQVMTAMTALLLAVSLIGFLCVTAIAGIIGLTAMCVLFAGFALALNAIPMDNIGKNKELILMLVDIMVLFTQLLTVLAIIGPFALIGVAAMAALETLVIATIAFAAVIGKLCEWFPSLTEFVDTGLDLMIRVAGGIGEMVGAFIEGALTDIISSLPSIGTNLSMFMTNAMPFITGAKLVDESVLTGVGILAGAILAFTVADLINGVASFVSGGSSFADLGLQLSQFMLNAMPFIMGASLVDESAMNGVKHLAQALLIITAADLLQNITSWVTGSSSMDTFATQLSKFGDAIVTFSGKVSGNIDEEAVTAATNAGKTIAQLYEALPKGGGWMQEIFGEASLDAFATQLTAFGTAIVGFSNKVKGNIDEEAVTAATNAGATVAGLYDKIPKAEGWAQKIFGEASLSTFGTQLTSFGESIVAFSDKVAGNIDESAVTAAANAGSTMAALASNLPKDPSWWDKLWGDDTTTMDEFGTMLVAFGQAIVDFSEKVSGNVSPESITAVADATKKVVNLIKSLQGLDTEPVGTFKTAVSDLAKVDMAGFYDSFSADKAENASSAVKKIVKLIKSMAGLDSSGIAEFKTALSELATVEISKFVDAFSSAATKLAQSGIDMMSGFVQGITSGTPRVLACIMNMLSSSFMRIQVFQPQFMMGGMMLATRFVLGLSTGSKGAGRAIISSLASAVASIMGYYFSFYMAGNWLGSGLVSGINAKKQAAYNAGYALGAAAAQGEKDGQKSNSPSKLTIQNGKWLGEGLVIGINKMGKSVYDAGYNMGKTATDSISGAVARITDVINSDIDTQPTIRPVLDLSDVADGANRMNGLFGLNPSVGLLSNVGSVSSMMNRNQNGRHNDVVSAIDKLSGKLDNRTGDTYTFGNFTYSGESEINDAVQTLIRAARIEGRT